MGPQLPFKICHISRGPLLVILFCYHYDDVIMGTIASQITSHTIVYSTVYSGADQSKHQSSASLAFVWGIHRGPVNSPHKWPVTRKMFPFADVIMILPAWGLIIRAYSRSAPSQWETALLLYRRLPLAGHKPRISRGLIILSSSFQHYDVIKWKHFPRYWSFVREIHRSTKASDAEL